MCTRTAPAAPAATPTTRPIIPPYMNAPPDTRPITRAAVIAVSGSIVFPVSCHSRFHGDRRVLRPGRTRSSPCVASSAGRGSPTAGTPDIHQSGRPLSFGNILMSRTEDAAVDSRNYLRSMLRRFRPLPPTPFRVTATDVCTQKYVLRSFVERPALRRCARTLLTVRVQAAPVHVAIQQGAAAGGSQAPVVNSRVRASMLSIPHLRAVDR